jgi:hypothetical protein
VRPPDSPLFAGPAECGSEVAAALDAGNLIFADLSSAELEGAELSLALMGAAS